MKNRTRRKGKKLLLMRGSAFKARELLVPVMKKIDEAVEHGRRWSWERLQGKQRLYVH